MKNTGIKILSAAVLCALALTGCADSTTSSSSVDTSGSSSYTSESSAAQDSSSEAASSEAVSSETQSIDESTLTEEQIYANMVDRSLVDLGNMERMAKFFEKLESGKEVTVAYIGGSITEGLTAGAEKCWAKLSYDRLCEMYPDNKINYVNAGMSGTPSVLGNIRLKRDVLDSNPDLVFVEFAVNDGNDQLYKDSYEALVRKVLSQDNQPAVALYFTVIKSGHTCEAYMSEVGKAYGLPMVSLNNVLAYEFEKGRMTWEDYSDDESHPNVWGHEMTCDLIMNMLNKAKEKAAEMTDVTVSALPETWVYSDRFANMELVDREHSSDRFTMLSTGSFTTDTATASTFPDGWTYKGVPSECEAMEFEFTGKNLMLVYKCANSKVFGSLKITVDDNEVGTFATAANDGWNNPVAVLTFAGEDTTHKVSIIPVTQSGEDSVTYVEILGFGIA